jgi:EAL domain-containing protein (putative c-di-GMP-specific phosphodiesterase class I)/GGDEF domain-containing protein
MTLSHAAASLLRYSTGDRAGPLSRLLDERALTVHFQPIVALSDARIAAHEALIRGPRDMPLQSPDALFAAARREGLAHDLEVACVVLALERWSAQGQPGRLFVNISASAMVRCFKGHGAAALSGCVQALGVDPGCLTFEITEHEHVSDIPLLVSVVNQVTAAGMRLALDDFGDGRSSLRLWSELGPDVVKVDKYFTREISSSAQRLKTLRALMQIAETFGTTLVAEGVETADDLRLLRDLGIPLAQGYFLGRPMPAARDRLQEDASQVLGDSRVAVMPSQRRAASPGRAQQAHVLEALTLGPQATHDEVAALFNQHTDWHALALVEDDRPVALMGRQHFFDRYAKQYFRELFGRKPCIGFANTTPTLVDVRADIDELARVLTSSDQRYLSEGFVYTENGRYRGLGTGHQLVRQVTESRIEAARHANPLTLLPGNIPISEHIERLLAARARFVCCYADLRDFKPFNDHFGYWRGDEMIKLLARTAQNHSDPRRDFVGHVGGDDFVILFQSEDWNARCTALVSEFNAAAIQLYDDHARQAGGLVAEDRQGVSRFFGFTSVYMGAVPVSEGHRFKGAAELASAAARAKQAAKARAGELHLLTDFAATQPG